MFGVKTHQRRDLVEGLTRVLVVLGKNQKYDTDQTLLSKIFWPTVKHDVVYLVCSAQISQNQLSLIILPLDGS